MKEYCDAHGVNVVLSEGYQAGGVDFKPILQKVKSLRPDIVYMVSYLMDASLLMRQSKELDINPQAFIGGARGPHAPRVPPERRGRLRVLHVGAPSGRPQAKYPGAKEFFDNFKKKFNKEPDYHGVEAYAAAYVLADTLKRAKSWTPDDLRAALAETNMMTAFGPVKFVSWGKFTNQNRMETLVLQVIKGRSSRPSGRRKAPPRSTSTPSRAGATASNPADPEA